MTTINVGIIDDGYPVLGDKRLSLETIEKLTTSEENWGQEESLRELSISLSSESRKWKRRIQFEAFNHPQTFKEEVKNNHDFLIYDWEYKPVAASTDDFYDILQSTTSKIFIYSAYDKIDKIPILLGEEKFQQFQQQNRFEIKSKGSDEDTEDIIKSIMDKFNNGEDVIWENIKINIKPSRYLIDSDDFWKIKSIVGVEYLFNYVKHKNNTFDEESIEKLFDEYKDLFYIDSNKNILSSFETDLLKAGFGKLQQLTAIEALQAFGIDKLEEAKEKGYTEIK
jgi:hypothetical protein